MLEDHIDQNYLAMSFFLTTHLHCLLLLHEGKFSYNMWYILSLLKEENFLEQIIKGISVNFFLHIHM